MIQIHNKMTISSGEKKVDNLDAREKINYLRRKITVHSYIYYRLGSSIIDDAKFDGWSKELVVLQSQHPETSKECIYASEFEGFDATTGFDLPRDEWVERVAQRLLDYDGKLKLQ